MKNDGSKVDSEGSGRFSCICSMLKKRDMIEADSSTQSSISPRQTLNVLPRVPYSEFAAFEKYNSVPENPKVAF